MKYAPEIIYIVFILLLVGFVLLTHYLDIFRVAYITLSILYLWYRYILLAASDLGKKDSYPEFRGKISVVIPSFNEDPKLLTNTVVSVLKNTESLDAEIIVGDDGSKVPVSNVLTIKDERLRIIRTEKNQGKRHIQKVCILGAKGSIIVFIDSDTIINSSTIPELLKPFADKTVGACTGQIKILNESDNLLTKATSALYWSAFNVGRKSLSKVGAVITCSGALSAFRKDLLESITEDYINQKFFGNKCISGDDRTLTNFVLEKKFKVHYVEESIAYTYSPPELKAFIKQQLRWRKSMLRESSVCLSFAWEDQPILFFECAMQLFLPFISLVTMLGFIFYSFIYPPYVITLIIGLFFVTFLHNMYFFFTDYKRARHAFVYSFLSEFILSWTWFVALLTSHREKWSTR